MVPWCWTSCVATEMEVLLLAAGAHCAERSVSFVDPGWLYVLILGVVTFSGFGKPALPSLGYYMMWFARNSSNKAETATEESCGHMWTQREEAR